MAEGALRRGGRPRASLPARAIATVGTLAVLVGMVILPGLGLGAPPSGEVAVSAHPLADSVPGVHATFTLWTPTTGTELIQDSNQSVNDPVVVPLAQTQIRFNVTIWCSATYPTTNPSNELTSVQLSLAFLGVNLHTWGITGINAACPYIPRTVSLDVSDLSGEQWILSGDTVGTFTVTNASGGTPAGLWFLAKLIPSYPVTIITAILLIIAIYEVYNFGDSLWEAAKLRRQARARNPPKSSEPPSGPTGGKGP